jgi:hypothetical protein
MSNSENNIQSFQDVEHWLEIGEIVEMNNTLQVGYGLERINYAFFGIPYPKKKRNVCIQKNIHKNMIFQI